MGQTRKMLTVYSRSVYSTSLRTYVNIRISQAPLRRMLYAQRMHVHTKIEGSNTLARRKSNNCTQSYTHIERHRDNVTSISKISYPYIFYILSNRKSFREA